MYLRLLRSRQSLQQQKSTVAHAIDQDVKKITVHALGKIKDVDLDVYAINVKINNSYQEASNIFLDQSNKWCHLTSLLTNDYR